MKSWRQVKIARAATPEGGETIATAFAAAWPVRLGREDAGGAGPDTKVPVPGAPVAEIKAYFKLLNNKDPEGKSGCC